MIKILNCYSGIGGNRKLWGKDIKVIAVEINPKIAGIYKDFFPNDEVIIDDAHDYLLKHFEEYDFIWSSPPCPSHSIIRKSAAWKTKKNGEKWRQNAPIYPDMKLYEEILLLDNYFNGKYVVENVVSFYEPLIKPQEIGSHYFWANFTIPSLQEDRSREHDGTIEMLQVRKGFDLGKYGMNSDEKRLLLRNCVEPELGKHIFDAAFRNKQMSLI